jgi:hypothetical protein
VPPDEAGFFVFFALLIFGFVKLNVWNYRRRKEMTPEQRKREDDEMHTPGEW